LELLVQLKLIGGIEKAPVSRVDPISLADGAPELVA
jgi:hypothetical protein